MLFYSFTFVDDNGEPYTWMEPAESFLEALERVSTAETFKGYTLVLD